ncbi:transcriptional regulator [Longispora fulva]|uniref:GntR family transcriptional regulator n=1 Tax=Longispora fulva TaxID=619741 RepID=A0A8J7GP33_9ACTN|nr:GntR family transcriptional regulator [Longispora fulva]MBG6134176.1 GntR family transcriptional regulator [Longispora fulva]GIG62549.1 transcriptional regulator [Longispora fulva]
MTTHSGAVGRKSSQYELIASDLLEKIRSGSYRPGQALPPQNELSLSYGVSLMTLRRALLILSDQGLIVQQQGKGTFVAPPQSAYRLSALRSLTDDLREQGQQVITQVLGVGRRKTPAALPDLEAGPDGRALQVKRLRLINGKPAIHQVSWVAEPYGSQIENVDLQSVALYAALADIGQGVNTATETIRIAAATAAVAKLLGLAAGTSVFRSERVTYGVSGDVLVWDEAFIHSRFMEIRTERAAAGVSVRWTPSAAHSPARAH